MQGASHALASYALHVLLVQLKSALVHLYYLLRCCADVRAARRRFSIRSGLVCDKRALHLGLLRLRL